MAQVVLPINAGNVIAGAAMLLLQSRDVALTTISAITTPAPTPTTFTCSTTDAAKISTGDLLQLAATSATNLAAEAAALPMVLSLVSGTAGYNVTLSNGSQGSFPTTAAGVRQQWSNRGATDGGITLTANRDVSDLFVDQTPIAVGTVDKQLTVTLEAPLAEAYLANFALAAGQKDPTTGTILQINSTDASRTDRYLFIGKAPNGLNRWAVLHKGKSHGQADQKSDKANKPIFKLQVTAYVDSAMNPDTLDIKDA